MQKIRDLSRAPRTRAVLPDRLVHEPARPVGDAAVATGISTTRARSTLRRSRRFRARRPTRTACACATMIGLDQRPLSEGEVRRARHGYYAAVSYLDERVGEVLDALAATGLASRHAGRLHGRPRRAAGRARPLVQDVVPRGLRARAADRARPGPGGAPRARARLAARPRPDPGRAGRRRRRPGPAFEGTSLVGAPRGESREARPRRWASTWPRASRRPAVMIRRGRHKYIRCPGDPDLLYDLETDPLELRNLAAAPDGAGSPQPSGRRATSAGTSRSSSARAREPARAAPRCRARWRDGAYAPWDFQPYSDASLQYVRSESARGSRPGRSRPAGGLPPSSGARSRLEPGPRRTSSPVSSAPAACDRHPGGWSEAGACDGRCPALVNFRAPGESLCLTRLIDGDFGALARSPSRSRAWPSPSLRLRSPTASSTPASTARAPMWAPRPRA